MVKVRHPVYRSQFKIFLWIGLLQLLQAKCLLFKVTDYTEKIRFVSFNCKQMRTNWMNIFESEIKGETRATDGSGSLQFDIKKV